MPTATSHTTRDLPAMSLQVAASERTHYDELGISRSAPADELRRAYRRLALQLHPDKCSEADAAARFIRVNQAWETLSKPSSRRAYDMELDARKAQLQQLQANRTFVYAGLSPIAKLLDLLKAAEDAGKVKIAELKLESERCGVNFPTDVERAELLKQLSRSAQGKLDDRIRNQDWSRLAKEDLAAWLEMHGCSLQYALACDTVDKDRLMLLVRRLLSKKGSENAPQQEKLFSTLPPTYRTYSSSGCDSRVRGGVAGAATPARSPSKPPLSTPKAKAKSWSFQAKRGRGKAAKSTKAKVAKANPLFAFAAPKKRSRQQRQPSRSLSEPWGTPTPKAKPKAKKAFEGEEAQERPSTNPVLDRTSTPTARHARSKPEKRRSPEPVSTPVRQSVRSNSLDSSSTSSSPSSTSSSTTTSSPPRLEPKRPKKKTSQPEGQLNQRIEELRADLQAVRSEARSDHPKALPTLVELVKLENEQRIDAIRQRRLLGELNKAWWRREVHGSVAWHASSLVLKWTARREATAKSKASE